jgi:hypothetical protein
VSYIDENNKRARTETYKARNFLGTSDWAISLDTADLVVPDASTIDPKGGSLAPLSAVDPQFEDSCTQDHKMLILNACSEAGEISEAPWKMDALEQVPKCDEQLLWTSIRTGRSHGWMMKCG